MFCRSLFVLFLLAIVLSVLRYNPVDTFKLFLIRKYQQGYIDANIWYYYIKDVQQIFFIDVTYQNWLNNIFFYELGGQFDLGRSVGSQSIGLVDANTLGVYATISAYGVSFTTAFNKNYGASAAVNSVGGGPFFTSMEQMICV